MVKLFRQFNMHKDIWFEEEDRRKERVVSTENLEAIGNVKKSCIQG